MKELDKIFTRYDLLKKEQANLILATVVNVEGSSYRRPGARMLIEENGNWTGGVSGGCLEGDLLKKAMMVLSTGKNQLVRYDTTSDDPYQIGVGLGCKGIIDILLSPLDSTDNENTLEVLLELNPSRNEHTIIHACEIADSEWPYPQSTIFERVDTLKKAEKIIDTPVLLKHIESCTKQKLSRLIRLAEGYSFFIEYFPPRFRLFIAGHEYDTIPVLEIASDLGWQSSLFCKPAKITKKQFQLADEIFSFVDFDSELKPPDNHSAVVLMTHDYKRDKRLLEICLESSVPYIGILGPRTRAEQMIEEIENQNPGKYSFDDNRLHYPAGLDIGALEPEEIAVSMISEIIASYHSRAGGKLRLRSSPIHKRTQ